MINKSRKVTIMKFFSLLIIIFFISGCSLVSKKISIRKHQEPIIVDSDSSISSESLVSTTENVKLKKIMRKFDNLIFTKLNLEAQNGEEDMFFDKNIQSSLKEFIRDSQKIQSLYPNADDEYIKLAQSLKKESTKLYKIVKIKKTEWVEPQVENIINICNQCHNIYAPLYN